MIGKALISRGFRIRRNLDLGYYAIWFNGKTWRLDLDGQGGDPLPLPPGKSEFYDVSLGTRCNACCDFCYTSAESKGTDYQGTWKTWQAWMDTLGPDTPVDPTTDEVWAELTAGPKEEDAPEMVELKAMIKVFYTDLGLPALYTEKPFQIAIGSQGEPTIHPDFELFLAGVYQSGVIPNYTTNGITLAAGDDRGKQLLLSTSLYCAGVAVSYGNPALRPKARIAIENLRREGRCKVMIHHIISDKDSVDEFLQLAKDYGADIHYHVLLPLMKHGRSKEGMTPGTFEYMAEGIHREGIEGRIALGANFAPYLKSDPTLLPVWEYPCETYSKSRSEIVITPSSFDQTPCQVLSLS